MLHFHKFYYTALLHRDYAPVRASDYH